MYSSQIYCVIKRPFFARAANHHILPSLLDMYNISLTHISCRVEASDRLSNICEWWCSLKGGLYDHFGPSRPQPQWHQPKKFLFPYPPRFLVRTLRRHPPDISAQLCLSLQCCVAIGFASQSIPGMKAFQFGLEMRFFLLILRGLLGYMGVSKKTSNSSKMLSQNY